MRKVAGIRTPRSLGFLPFLFLGTTMKRLLLLSMLFLTGCSAPTQFKIVKWSFGGDVNELKFLNEIDRSLPEENAVLDEKIEFSSQTYAGIEIENSFVKKINHRDGALFSVSSRYKDPDKHFRKLPVSDFKITAPLKYSILQKFSYIKYSDLQTLKPIIDLNDNLVWQVTYFDQNISPRMLRFSKELQILSDVQVGADWFDRPAVIFLAGPKLGPLKEVLLKNLSFSPPLSNPLFTISSDRSSQFDDSDKILKFPTDDNRFDQVQVYYYVEQALKFTETILGVKISFPINIQLHVGHPEKTNAAFYYNGKIRLGEGDDVAYSKIPQDPTIVSHEVFHALVDVLAHLPHEGEGGSLNEAFADFFTSQLLKSPQLGTSAYLLAPYKRSLDNEKKWQDKVGALYGDSLIISGLLWSLSTKIPNDKIQRVALKTLSHLNPASGFADFNQECRAALVQYLRPEELEIALKILAVRGFPE